MIKHRCKLEKATNGYGKQNLIPLQSIYSTFLLPLQFLAGGFLIQFKQDMLSAFIFLFLFLYFICF